MPSWMDNERRDERRLLPVRTSRRITLASFFALRLTVSLGEGPMSRPSTNQRPLAADKRRALPVLQLDDQNLCVCDEDKIEVVVSGSPPRAASLKDAYPRQRLEKAVRLEGRVDCW